MKFRLVDRIDDWEPFFSVRGRKSVSFEEYQLKTDFGGRAALPETLLLEAGFQLLRWLCILSTNFSKTLWVEEIGSTEFYRPLGPGEAAEISANIVELLGEDVRFDLHGSVNGDRLFVCRASLGHLRPLEDFFDPDDLRTLFSEISTVPDTKEVS